MNTRNYGIATGRLTRDVQTFPNKDGSVKVLFTVAAQDNFRDRKDVRNSQFLPFEAYISAESNKKNGLGVYALMHKGDLVTVQYTVKTPTYQGDNGETVYKTALVPESIDLLESKATTKARQESNSEAAQNGQPPVAKAGTAEAETPANPAEEDLPFGENNN